MQMLLMLAMRLLLDCWICVVRGVAVMHIPLYPVEVHTQKLV